MINELNYINSKYPEIEIEYINNYEFNLIFNNGKKYHILILNEIEDNNNNYKYLLIEKNNYKYVIYDIIDDHYVYTDFLLKDLDILIEYLHFHTYIRYKKKYDLNDILNILKFKTNIKKLSYKFNPNNGISHYLPLNLNEQNLLYCIIHKLDFYKFNVDFDVYGDDELYLNVLNINLYISIFLKDENDEIDEISISYSKGNDYNNKIYHGHFYLKYPIDIDNFVDIINNVDKYENKILFFNELSKLNT